MQRRGLAQPELLPESASHDVIVCTCFADIVCSSSNVLRLALMLPQTLDGHAELLLGTFDGSVLVYSAETSAAPFYRFNAVAPVFGVHVVELAHEGVRDIVIVTTRGYHVVQVRTLLVVGTCGSLSAAAV